ncbi:peptidylprolyl isomerase [Bradyrhizobium sp.]|jgi:peptidyl-prolyl cis-trans isomerase D|uniref:peptidylprolyl isomerase n=1 Tax=Bradyrhizobium sp. TaxID=376 RepID=UPI002E04B448|nr:SurA N-terminal domain-containing protein [Bradyrhizobium sp.]
MLRGIRKASSNWLGKLVMATVMGVLIISFAVWGIADIFKGFGQSTLAKIGRTEISTEQFRQLYTEKLQQIGRQVGRPVTMDQARAFGLDRQVLQQVIAEAALDDNARQLGLGQSDAQTMRMITSDPNFKGVSGAFDPARFQATIRQVGYTEGRYIAEQRRVSLRRQIANTITAGLEPPKTMIDALVRFQTEQRTIEYVKLDAAQAGTIDPPSPEALAAYFDDHKTQFRAPEYRKISFAIITPDEIGKWTTVSDEDAKKIFEERRDRLSTPERRQVSQIVFPNVEEAQAARGRIASGLSFDDLAKERGLNPSDVDLGIIAKSSMIDPAIADAAFSLAPDTVSQPAQGRFGTALVKVGKIEPGTQARYESIAPQLKREIAAERARTQIASLHDKMEDERGGGAGVVEAAQKLGLGSVTIDAIDRSGRAPNGQPVTGIPQGLNVVTQAFSSDVGVDNDPIQFNGGYVWFDVLGITPSRERGIDEVKDQVETRWRDDQVSSRLRAKATEIVQKLNHGAKLADEAASLGRQVDTAAGFRRDATLAGVPTSLIEAAFRTPKDVGAQAPGAGGAEWVVFRVTDVSVPPVDLASDEIKKLKETLLRGLSDEQVAEYVTKLEAQIGTTINQSALAQVTGANN